LNSSHLVIAIDGHSSCGKSTLARQLAQTLGYIFVDTGAMYRAVTLAFLRQKVDIENPNEVSEALNHITISFVNRNGLNTTILNGEDVEAEIRSIQVSGFVSQVAAIPAVRKKMVALQQAMDHGQGVVMDGRDIGTVVFPGADLKLFVTADVEVRAERRYKELVGKGEVVSLHEIKENLSFRDKIDSEREDSPLVRASDAILIDNSLLSIQEQFDMAWKLAQEAITKKRMLNN
jgi:cytidylate kinase